MTTARTSSSQTEATGCYGFRLTGIDDARELLIAAPAGWPRLELRRARARSGTAARDEVGTERAELPLHRGSVTIERDPARVTFRLRDALPDGDLVHPYLAPAAAVMARWAGRESFHGGAFIVDGGAWVVLGDKEHGKSTTLAWLALQGVGVLADDLAVIDGGVVLAGPRCVDLREESARRLGAGEPLGVVGVRERWRVTLPPAAAELPLRGWVTLAWDDEVGVSALRGPERMLALLPHRSVRLEPGAPEALLNLSSLPVWRLARPRRWDSLAIAGPRLLEAIAG